MDEERKAYEKRRLNTNALRALITEGETILWEGAPKSSLRLHRSERSSIPAGVLMAGMSMYGAIGVYSDLKNGEPFTFGTLFAGAILLFFFCMGCYLTFGKYISDARNRQNTYYAVTDQRLIFIEPHQIRSLQYDQVTCLELEPHDDGSGTIFLSPKLIPTTNKRGQQTMATDLNRKGLYCIPDATHVYNLIQTQLNALY